MKFNLFKHFRHHEAKPPAVEPVPPVHKTQRAIGEICSSRGTSPASKEQKRQKRARMITRRRP